MAWQENHPLAHHRTSAQRSGRLAQRPLGNLEVSSQFFGGGVIGKELAHFDKSLAVIGHWHKFHDRFSVDDLGPHRPTVKGARMLGRECKRPFDRDATRGRYSASEICLPCAAPFSSIDRTHSGSRRRSAVSNRLCRS
ncbi:hypothetical protein SFHH103_02783 [Sinorhizobium fredii HH103]|uniref:Uncharacterized protein n=1 Tax=Sinorhizobium fredii (strain HH103) TaxID=1117943 RepID=G9ABI4_SINF1|nr:hypothetical protein SFHH103_02783 [Sinorhizobium fredii HH103]